MVDISIPVAYRSLLKSQIRKLRLNLELCSNDEGVLSNGTRYDFSIRTRCRSTGSERVLSVVILRFTSTSPRLPTCNRYLCGTGHDRKRYADAGNPSGMEVIVGGAGRLGEGLGVECTLTCRFIRQQSSAWKPPSMKEKVVIPWEGSLSPLMGVTSWCFPIRMVATAWCSSVEYKDANHHTDFGFDRRKVRWKTLPGHLYFSR